MATDLFTVSLLLYNDNFASFISRCLKLTLYSAGVLFTKVRTHGFVRKFCVRKNTTIRYDTSCYFNVRSKADISQLNLPHGNRQ